MPILIEALTEEEIKKISIAKRINSDIHLLSDEEMSDKASSIF
jgi:hypothetical protein